MNWGLILFALRNLLMIGKMAERYISMNKKNLD